MRDSAGGTPVPLGPRGNAVFGSLWPIYRDPLGFVVRTARDCGEVARYRVAHVVVYQVSSPAGVERVLHSNHRNYSKDVATFEPLRRIVGNGLFTSDGAFWLRQRRLMQPAFHRRRIALFGDLITGSTLAMLDRWRPLAAAGAPFDAAGEFMRLTLEVVTRALFSASVGRDAGEIGRAITTLLEDVTFRFSFPFYPPPRVPTPRNRRFLAARSALDRAIYGIIASRRREGGGRDDLPAMLMEARDEGTGEGMSDRQLRDEVMTMFLAGHETTANALAWATYLLATHVEPARRLREEADRVLGERPPTPADLPSLPYTRMVLDEAMRLYPPVWVTDRRAVEGDSICGYRIPAGATVSISPYATHHDPEVWESPEAFDPERFASGAATERPDYAYFPFGGGPRQCIGKGFALMEATMALALLAQRVELRLVPGYPVAPVAMATLRPRHGVWVTAHPRGA